MGGIGSSGSGDAERANAWESRFGWRVDFMAAAAYLGGPVTGTHQPHTHLLSLFAEEV